MDDRIPQENRRLRRENARLRERIDALEASRWWRLHPNRLLKRIPPKHAPDGLEVVNAGAAGSTAGSSFEQTRAVERFRVDVVSRGAFTETWFLTRIRFLEPLVEELTDRRSIEVLEIGSFEGLSTCFFLSRLPRANLTCVDTFAGSVEHVAYGQYVNDLEVRFDKNVALVDSSRVRKIRGDSKQVLLELLGDSALFDLIYVDGSHLALDVLVDGALSWQLLRDDGILVFDDYRWRGLGPDPLMRPKAAIDALLKVVGEHARLLLQDDQVAIRKLD